MDSAAVCHLRHCPKRRASIFTVAIRAVAQRLREDEELGLAIHHETGKMMFGGAVEVDPLAPCHIHGPAAAFR